jgi:glyoxylase-like metal-dependent hydrolase (beta-lactamase superfamily II)
MELNEQVKNTCCTCGTQYKAGTSSPEFCPICNDDRQYLTEDGQIWTNSVEILANHQVVIRELSPTLFSLQVNPTFALGQRALLALSPGGNILWDCIPLLNQEIIDFIRSKGGIKAIAFSHPHFYSNVNEWAEIFDCLVYIHAADDQWMFNKGPRIRFWQGTERQLWDGISIINTGGHFPGSSILRVPALSAEAALLTGDSIYVAKSKRHLAFMYSYPNVMPLPEKELIEVIRRVEQIKFDTIYGGFEWQNLTQVAKEVFWSSVTRYGINLGTHAY